MPHPAELGVTHVIFDMDGLLLDTEPLYTSATETVAARHGSTDPTGAPRPFTWDLKVRQMGLPSKDLARLIVKELALPISPDQYTVEVRQLQEKTFPNCNLLPGAERLVRKYVDGLFIHNDFQRCGSWQANRFPWLWQHQVPGRLLS